MPRATRGILAIIALGLALAVGMMHSGLDATTPCGGMGYSSKASTPGGPHASHVSMCLSTPVSVNLLTQPDAAQPSSPLASVALPPAQMPPSQVDMTGREPPDPVTELCVMRT